MRFHAFPALVALVFAAVPAFAAVPRQVPFQGVLLNPGPPQTPKPDGTYGVQFRLYDALAGGTLLWQEPANGFKSVTVTRGTFATRLGESNPFPALLAFDQPYFLEVQISGEAPMTPRVALGSVPYALTSQALALPYAASVELPGSVFEITNTGVGAALRGVNNFSGSQGSGVVGIHGSAGRGVYGYAPSGFGVYGQSGADVGVQGLSVAGAGVQGNSSNGPGLAGYHTGVSGTQPGVYGQTNSTTSEAAGVLGVVSPTASDAFTAGVRGVNNGTGGNGIGVHGRHAGGGWGVYGVSESGHGVYGRSATGAGVAAISTQTLFQGFALSGPFALSRFRVDNTGKVFANGGFQAGGADVAEFIRATTAVEAGDVVEIDPDHDGQFRRAATARSTAVAGVVSTQPGLTLNAVDPAGRENAAPQLAMMGRVPVKASAENGPIRRGDLLVASSTPGHAMRAGNQPAAGSVIGKALSPLAGGRGAVEMLVMLR